MYDWGSRYKYVQGGPIPTRWMAPEAIKKRRFSEQTDVWAFGVLCWEVATNVDVPYFEKSNDDDVSAYVLQGGRLPRPDDCSDALWRVMLSCWSVTLCGAHTCRPE